MTLGAAWAVPAITLVAPVPAFAASCLPHGILSFPDSGTDGNGWTISTSGASSAGSARFDAGTYVVDTDPPTSGTYTATAASAATLVGGATYQITYTYTANTAYSRSMTCDFRVQGVAIPGTAISTASSGTSGTVTTTFTMPTPASYVSFRMSISGFITSAGDDITITGFTLTCL